MQFADYGAEMRLFENNVINGQSMKCQFRPFSQAKNKVRTFELKLNFLEEFDQQAECFR